ncbi:MAG TPA: ABC transporter permease [Terriglobales bacterium]|nr:ABC transporter permease [Terriglobales bacterium]
MDEELAQHAEQLESEALARGLSPAQAHAVAMAELAQFQHRARFAGGWGELRAIVRGLRRRTSFSLLVVATLGLAIGASTAMFTLVDAVLLRPLPYRAPQQLVALLETSKSFPMMSLTWPDYLEMRDGAHSFSAFAATRGSDMILTHLEGQPATMVRGTRVTANYFAMLGVTPALGRTFSTAEDGPGAPDVVVLTSMFFEHRLGGDIHWLGRTLDLDGRARTIIGVMPAGFPGIAAPEDEGQFYTPLGAFAAQDAGFAHPGNHAGTLGLARLRPGVSLSQARAELNALADRLAREHPATDAGNQILAQPYLDLLVGNVQSSLLLLQLAVGLLLAIACANVANLMLARGVTRAHDLALRSVLGASRARLWMAQLAESFLLALAGAGVGVALAAALLRLVPRVGLLTLPRLGAAPLRLDARACALAIGLGIVCSLVCGAASVTLPPPVVRSSSAPPARRRLRSILIIAEMALALLLIVGTGLLLRSLTRLVSGDIGFQAPNRLSFVTGLSDVRYPTRAAQLAFFDQAMSRLAALPGVAAAGGVYPLPLSGDNWQQSFRVMGHSQPRAEQQPSADIAEVRGRYFEAMGIPLVAGRLFNPHDAAGAPEVAIVDRNFARRFAGLGQQIELDRVRTIVGVVDNIVDYTRMASSAGAQIYLPQAQSDSNTGALFFVLHSPAAGLRQAAMAQIQSLDPDQPVDDVMTMQARLDLALATSRRVFGLMAAFAALALLLAVIGVYGVVSFAVAERRHELGIRLALGAAPRRLTGMVLRQGVVLAAVGGAIGILIALAGGRLIAALLYQVPPDDPITLASAFALLVAVAALASYLPARRARQVDPLQVLKAT